MGDLTPFVPRRLRSVATVRRKMHRNLASEMPSGKRSRGGGENPPSDIARRHELIARVLDRASRLLDDAEQETNRLRIRILQQAAGCLVVFAQEIAGNADDPLPGGAQ